MFHYISLYNTWKRSNKVRNFSSSPWKHLRSQVLSNSLFCPPTALLPEVRSMHIWFQHLFKLCFVKTVAACCHHTAHVLCSSCLLILCIFVKTHWLSDYWGVSVRDREGSDSVADTSQSATIRWAGCVSVFKRHVHISRVCMYQLQLCNLQRPMGVHMCLQSAVGEPGSGCHHVYVSVKQNLKFFYSASLVSFTTWLFRKNY